MKQAFVYLPSEGTEYLEWVLTDSSHSAFQKGEGPLDALTPLISGHQIIGVVASEQVLLTNTDLEFTQASKLRKAIPYALEDNLSEDVESLHFALGKIETGNTQVAIINDERLAGWKADFEAAGLHFRAIVPDLLLLPIEENSWSLLVAEERVLVRTGEFSGFTAEREGLEEFIMAILQNETMPESISVWYCGKTPKPMKWSNAAPPVTTPPCPHGPLALLATHWDPRQSLNLLQGSHSGEPELGKLLKPWRWVAVLFVLWMGVLFTGQVLEKNELQARQAELNKQMASIYRQTFPEARKVVNPRVQMEQKLRELKGGGNSSESDFMPLLAQSTSVLSKHSSVLLNNINFRSKRLTLHVSGKNLSDLDNLKNDIAGIAGLKAELAAADSGGGKASAQIRIEAQ